MLSLTRTRLYLVTVLAGIQTQRQPQPSQHQLQPPSQVAQATFQHWHPVLLKYHCQAVFQHPH
jgi:hypothetical protein